MGISSPKIWRYTKHIYNIQYIYITVQCTHMFTLCEPVSLIYQMKSLMSHGKFSIFLSHVPVCEYNNFSAGRKKLKLNHFIIYIGKSLTTHQHTKKRKMKYNIV